MYIYVHHRAITYTVLPTHPTLSLSLSLFFPASHLFFLSAGWLRLAREVVPILCTSWRFSHTDEVPSATAMTSWATRAGNMRRPLPRMGRFSTATRIHWKAMRRRWRARSGIGTGRVRPPPAMPDSWRMRNSGATESMASVRYCAGWSGRSDGDGEPGSKGHAGLVCGGGDVRRWFRTMVMSCCQEFHTSALFFLPACEPSGFGDG